MKRHKRIIIIVVLAAVAIFTADLLTIVAFGMIHPPVPRVDAVIVLGAKVGTPALTQRTIQGIKYIQNGKSDTIVLSGSQGPGENISEARAMQQLADTQIAKSGTKTPKIILEQKSINTFQNIHNSKELIPKARSVVIVSDCFHLARSVAIAKRDGFQTVYWDSPAPTYYPPWDLAYYYFREAIGMIAYIPDFITN